MSVCVSLCVYGIWGVVKNTWVTGEWDDDEVARDAAVLNTAFRLRANGELTKDQTKVFPPFSSLILYDSRA